MGDRNKKKIGIVAVCDYRTLPMGGEVSLLRNFLYADSNNGSIEFCLIGITFDKNEKIGCNDNITIGNNSYSWIPVANVTGSLKSRVPYRFQLVKGLYRCRKAIEELNLDAFYIHCPEVYSFCSSFMKPVIYHVHGNPYFTLRSSRFDLFRRGLFVKKYDDMINRALMGSTSVIWAARRSMEDYFELCPEGASTIKAKTQVIHSSVDPSMKQGACDFQFNPKRRYLITVSRLASIKRVDFLIDSFSAIAANADDVDFLICGDGEERQRLDDLSNSSGFSRRIHFLGRQEKDALATLLSTSDLFLFASESEAMSLVVLESLYWGTPVVTTKVGDLPEVVNENTGAVVAGYDKESYVKEILKCLNNGRAFYSDSCKEIASRFTATAMRASIETCLLRCLEAEQ